MTTLLLGEMSSAKYKKFSPISQHADKIKDLSTKRTNQHHKFIEIRKNIENFRKNKDSFPQVSLLE